MWELGLSTFASTSQIIFKFFIFFKCEITQVTYIRYTRLCNTCLENTGVPYLLYSSSAQYYLFRKKDNRPPVGNKCVLWRADPIIAEPGPVNYTSWRSLFWVSSFFLVTRVPMEYSYTYGEIQSVFAKMLMHRLLPIFKNQFFG